MDVRVQQGHHPGRWCFGRTRMMTFLDAIPMTKHKVIAT